MNSLTAEMRRSLKELDLGLKGELTITSDMEDLSNALFFDQVYSTLLKLVIKFNNCRFHQRGRKKHMTL